MFFEKPTVTIQATLRHILSHGVATLLAVAIAFSLPSAAGYILYEWWPLLEKDPNLLLITEVTLASILVLIFSLAQTAWSNRHLVNNARLAAIVHAHQKGNGWMSGRRERALTTLLPASRDVLILAFTGYDTFVSKDSLLRRILEKAYEIRVLLVNPNCMAFQKRVESLPEEITQVSFRKETSASLEYLACLRKAGKNVTVRFYDQEPLWKIVVLGDYVWVQHCHSGFEVKNQPEYVFALQRHNPRIGLFVPFYTHFLNEWNDTSHLNYDFDTNELIYRNENGDEMRRVNFEGPSVSRDMSALETEPPSNIDRCVGAHRDCEDGTQRRFGFAPTALDGAPMRVGRSPRSSRNAACPGLR
jgi:hypothetical protein